MKTSNKILIVLFVIVFSIPLLMAMSFKSAIRNNQYVVKHSYGYEHMPLNQLKPFKVVVLEASGGTLTCNIKYGKEYSYKWNNYMKKSHDDANSLISYKGDTLVIFYQPKTNAVSEQESYTVEADIDILLNQEALIIVKGATVNVNTLDNGYRQALHFDLTKNAKLNVHSILDHRPDVTDSLTERNRIVIPRYVIKSDSSDVNIEAHIRLNKLDITAARNSTLSISKDVFIDSLNASIAPETIVNAPYKFVSNFKPENLN